MKKNMNNNRKCKLMFFVYILGQGGAERVILNILNNIDNSKYDVYLALGEKEGNTYLKFLENKNIKIIQLDVPRHNDPLVTKRLADKIDEEDIDVLFTEAYYTNSLAYNAKRICKKNVKLIFREASNRVDRDRSLKYILKTFIMYNSCSKIVAVSHGVGDSLIKHFKISRKKVAVIHNPIDLAIVDKRKKEKIEDSKFNLIKGKKIVNVARLVPKKNHKLLIDAFNIVQQKIYDANLIIIGDGVLENELKEYVKNNNIKNVYFLGFKENPYKYVNKCDLFALSSNEEGCSNVLIEAMSLQVPIVSTDCKSGPREILDDDKCGSLVEVGNIQKLSEAIEIALTSKEIRNKYIKNSKEKIKKFDVINVVKEYEKIINSVYNKE